MPANKNQIRRIQTLLRMMRQSRYPNFTSFLHEMKNLDPAGAYNISSKTFQRDIADLRDEYGAPVRYDASRRGFYLTNTEWYNEDLMVEPFEMKAALLSERLASGIFPEPMRSEISKAVDSMLMKNESGMAEGVELENFQVICPDSLPKVSPDIFLAAYSAWEKHNFLRLVYRTVKKVQSEMLFEPHVFAWSGGNWYLKGKLHQDGAESYDPPLIRVLALHRIQQIERLENLFQPAPEILKKTRESGLFDFEKIPEAEIEFFAPFDESMAERFEHIPGAVIARTGNSVRVKLRNITEFDAAQLVFFTCGNAKVLAPESLRQFVRRIAEKVLADSKD